MRLIFNCKTIALALVLACGGCAVQPGSAAAPNAPVMPTDPAAAATLAELQNMEYSGLNSLAGPVKLRDGRWRGAPSDPAAATRDIVTLDATVRVVGDLDGDGVDEAVALLSHSPGGTAAWAYLAVVKREGGKMRHVASVALGDRVQIRSARIEAGRLQASVVRAGPNDPACCPGEIADQSWTLIDGNLKAHASVTTSRLSLDTLAGVTWVLRAWDTAEPAPLQPVVTLSYAAGRVTGSSGCNRYTAGVTPGSMPGELRVGLAASTRMACPEPESSVEARFLERLHTAQRFGFRSGQLAITAPAGSQPGTFLLFEASGAAAPK